MKVGNARPMIEYNENNYNKNWHHNEDCSTKHNHRARPPNAEKMSSWPQ